jgi:hypothetical protein
MLEHLVRHEKISTSRVDEALMRGCPKVWEWCNDARSRLSRKQLRDHILGDIPTALRVSLREITRGSLGRFGWHSKPPRLTFGWAAHFDVLSDGDRMHTIILECVAKMYRDTGAVERDQQTNRLRIDPDVAWVCNTEMTLCEQTNDTPAIFHSEEGEVSFPSPLL